MLEEHIRQWVRKNRRRIRGIIPSPVIEPTYLLSCEAAHEFLGLLEIPPESALVALGPLSEDADLAEVARAAGLCLARVLTEEIGDESLKFVFSSSDYSLLVVPSSNCSGRGERRARFLTEY